MSVHKRVGYVASIGIILILVMLSVLLVLRAYSVHELAANVPAVTATSSLEENTEAAKVVTEDLSVVEPKSVAEDVPCTERPVSSLLSSIEKQFFASTTVWERTAYYVAPAREADPYGWMSGADGSSGTPILPCESVMVLTASKQPTFMSEDNGIDDWLKQNGWRDEMLQEFTSDSTGGSIGVALGHAGGPQGMSTMFTRPLYSNRAVEFFAITTQQHNENFAAYLDDIAPDPCPCGMTVTFRHSFPVSFAAYLD